MRTCRRTLTTLAHEFLPGKAFSNPEKTIVLMHGILGSKGNWKTFSRQLLRQHQAWQVLLVDHRGHGDSPSFQGPHTVQDCSRDVINLLQQYKIQPQVVCGHSFGGKVALNLLQQQSDSNQALPRHLWVLDAMPGTSSCDYASHGSSTSSVSFVLPRLRQVETPIESKDEMVRFLKEQGVIESQALWMTTNLKAMGEKYDWKFDLNVVEELYESFLGLDCWPLLDNPPLNSTIHVVHAERNRLWKKAKVLERFGSEIQVHELKDADHWVHIDNPKGLAALLSESMKQ